jgi:carboxypeptidase-like protein
MRRQAFLLLLVLWGADAASGQLMIRGRVTDAQTGQSLVAATVQVQGRALGTVTNADGVFTLALPGLPAVLLIRYIGYRSQRIALDAAPTGVVEVRLEPDPFLMPGVVVTGEDPGLGVMRQVLARKQAWRDTVQTAYSEVYTRFMLYREFDLVQVEETIGANWWKAGRGVRQITRARKSRPDRSDRFLYAGVTHVPNLYDDEITLEATRFRGPLHPDALRFYRFRLTDQRAQDGRAVLDISFSPTNLAMAGFIGTLAVQDSTFDVLAITARPVVDRIGPPPILERTVRLEERFVRRGGGMVPVYFSTNGWVRFGRAGVSYPRARYRQVSGLSLHATRVPVPDSLFRSARPLRDDPDVRAGQWLFDWNPGMIPLSEEEAGDVLAMRSDRSLSYYFRPEGLLSSYAAVPVAAPLKRPESDEKRELSLLKPWLWYNRVDGWHVGLRPVIPFGSLWTARPGLGYAEASGSVPWTLSLEREAGGPFDLQAGMERFTAPTGVGTRRDRFLTGLAAYAGYDDYFDYYDRARRWVRLGVASASTRAQLTLSHEDHRSVQKNDSYDGWLRENVQRENPEIEEGRLASATLRLTAGDVGMTRSGYSGYLDLQTEVAGEGVAGSDFGFARWQAAGSFRLPTFMRRRSIPASLRVDVVAGGGTDGVPIQRQGILDVATGPVAGAVGFRSRRDARLTAPSWLAVFWEHDFGGAISEVLGLGESRLGFVIFGAHGTAWHDSAVRRDEVGVAWSKPFNLPLRVNLASELAGFNPIVTVEYYGLARRLFGQ